MTSCLNCPKRETCKEICPEVEKLLPKVRGGTNGKREFFLTQEKLEWIEKNKNKSQKKNHSIYDQDLKPPSRNDRCTENWHNGR
jgi:hypothetical protein